LDSGDGHAALYLVSSRCFDRYLRGFTGYVARPIRSIRQGSGGDKTN
jgi:hypothetical protein